MFENQAKGWHGSYSTIGRSSAEKYPMILIKDKILSDKCEKKIIKDYFNTEEEYDANKFIIDDGEDIFSQTVNKKNRVKKRLIEYCEHKNKEKIPDEYKYHQKHHKDLYDYNLILKNQKNYGANLTMYMPKKDFTWRRTLTGPYWDSLTGRDKNAFFNPKIDNLNSNFYIDHNTFKNENKTFQMDKQIKRGNLPISNDLRIRIEEPFGERSYKNKHNVVSKTIPKKNEKAKNGKKKDNKNNNHSLNFAKNLSRDQYYFLFRDRKGVRPFFNPNYNLIEPKSLSMVKYNQKLKSKSSSRRMQGVDSNLFFVPDKYINDHKVNNAPNLRTMVGRCDSSEKNNIFLPAHMINNFGRNSLEVLTEKGLKMNNFIDSEVSNNFSSFCNKKSFNMIINHNLLKDSQTLKESKMGEITKKLNTKERIKKLMEFYSKNLDNQELGNTYRKFDGITFKSIKSPDNLSEKEKKLFSLKLDN